MRKIFLLICLGFLAGCQTIPTLSPQAEVLWFNDEDYFQQQLKKVANLDSWQYSAKVGVTTSEAREQANMVWYFTDDASNVRLFGPLGVGAIRIDFDRFGVVLSDNKGVLHRGNNAEELLTRIVGWPIPIDALGYWLFAVPDPANSYRYQLNEGGYVSVLEQQGWSIEYSNYKDYSYEDNADDSLPSANSRFLPRKLVAKKEVAGQGQVVVKLITKNWK